MTITQEKWDKGKAYLQQLVDLTGWDCDLSGKIDTPKLPKVALDYKLLERIRGYLCHLAMTYPILFLYLKGFHLTLSAHLPSRDKEGWKRSDFEQAAIDEALRSKGMDVDNQYYTKALSRVVPVERFNTCLTALTQFFKQKTPPSHSCRKSKFHFLVYGFVDASKSGLGSTKAWDDKTTVRMGTWGPDADNELSNWRELANMVKDLESKEDSGDLNNSWIILATDNSTAEGCLYKVNSPSRKLFKLVVRLRSLELRTGATILVTHVLGKRMVAQGTDGVSRGCLKEGICLGDAMLIFCPWRKAPIDASPTLLGWIRDWFGERSKLLKPMDWYRRGHDHYRGYQDQNGQWMLGIKPGSYIWNLPPVAAAAAIEEL